MPSHQAIPAARPITPGHHINIALYLILTLLTCGLFNLYWNYRQMEACNALLLRREFRFWLWLLLTVVTCGIYHIFYQYKMGAAIVEIQHSLNRPVFDKLPLLSVIVTLVGLSIVVDCIHQHEINKIND
ncbi:MAG: DUF4234 domain-containing protein [Desulfobacterales bacterium]|nr:MAG: DUF4234 domain-containing protein [Desulfobacterales bacterium]